jgi:hypothetical protein
MYNTRSTKDTNEPLFRIAGPLCEYFDKINKALNIEERSKYFHKIYILVNANKILIMNEPTLVFPIYQCALRNRICIVCYPIKNKKMVHLQKQMEKFIEYFETFCLNGSQLTPNLFQYIASFI